MYVTFSILIYIYNKQTGRIKNKDHTPVLSGMPVTSVVSAFPGMCLLYQEQHQSGHTSCPISTRVALRAKDTGNDAKCGMTNFVIQN